MFEGKIYDGHLFRRVFPISNLPPPTFPTFLFSASLIRFQMEIVWNDLLSLKRQFKTFEGKAYFSKLKAKLFVQNEILFVFTSVISMRVALTRMFLTRHKPIDY
jgi:hypothetical protein